jgi:hypothetical protein
MGGAYNLAALKCLQHQRNRAPKRKLISQTKSKYIMKYTPDTEDQLRDIGFEFSYGFKRTTKGDELDYDVFKKGPIEITIDRIAQRVTTSFNDIDMGEEHELQLEDIQMLDAIFNKQ